MNLSDVMDELAEQLDTIAGLRVKAHPVDDIQPPAGVVGLPDSLTFDAAYRRGMDTMLLPVVVLVGKVSDRAARKKLASYCDGSGPTSIKAVLEAGTYTAFDTESLQVKSVAFDVIRLAAVDYLGATFTISIAGQGAS